MGQKLLSNPDGKEMYFIKKKIENFITKKDKKWINKKFEEHKHKISFPFIKSKIAQM